MKGSPTEGVNLLKLFGDEIQALYTHHEGTYEYTVLHYVSGIDQFDELLAPKKFHETPAVLNVTSHLSGIFIILIYSGKPKVFAFSRHQIVSVKEIPNQEIYVFNDNRFAKRLKSGGGGGPLFYMALGAIGDAIIPKGSKKVSGKIYELILLDNGEKHKVHLARPTLELEYDEKRSEVDAFIRAHFTKETPTQKVKFDTDSGCFIATACYGSYFHSEVAIFREFRDKVLLKCRIGIFFTRLYYKLSPSLAVFIERNRTVRWVVVHAIIRPIYRILKGRRE